MPGLGSARSCWVVLVLWSSGSPSGAASGTRFCPSLSPQCTADSRHAFTRTLCCSPLQMTPQSLGTVESFQLREKYRFVGNWQNVENNGKTNSISSEQMLITCCIFFGTFFLCAFYIGDGIACNSKLVVCSVFSWTIKPQTLETLLPLWSLCGCWIKLLKPGLRGERRHSALYCPTRRWRGAAAASHSPPDPRAGRKREGSRADMLPSSQKQHVCSASISFVIA